MSQNETELPDQPEGSAGKRALALGAGGALVVVAGVLVATIVVPSADDSADDSADGTNAATSTATDPNPAPTTVPGSSASRTAESEVDEPAPSPLRPEEETGAVLTDFLDASAAALQSGGTEQVDVDTIAQGFVRGEIEATAAEFAVNGWRQEGSVTVAEVRTAAQDLDANPPTTTLWVCLDSAQIRIVDETGRVVHGTADGPDRVPHLYTFVLADDQWKVAEHSFPREATC